MIVNLIIAGFIALKEYIALHVLTCLVPAFLLAGAMVNFISREAVISYLGHAARKTQSFVIASVGSFFLAACSCTVIPVASGLYYQGSGVGPAFIILWIAPAANILALVYTGAILGTSMVLARISSALAMAFVVGLVMSAAFHKTELNMQADIQHVKDVNKIIKYRVMITPGLVIDGRLKSSGEISSADEIKGFLK